jgi:hypothetical protein
VNAAENGCGAIVLSRFRLSGGSASPEGRIFTTISLPRIELHVDVEILTNVGGLEPVSTGQAIAHDAHQARVVRLAMATPVPTRVPASVRDRA